MQRRHRIQVNSLRDSSWTNQLIRDFRDHKDDGIEVDVSNARAVYPNGAVPLAAAISLFNELEPESVTVQHGQASRLGSILRPITIGTFDRGMQTLTDSVWRYDNEEDAQKLARLFIEDALRDSVRCEEGVIDTINWCLYEVMDNVFQHSQAGSGFVMMQLHKRERRCAISVADTGIGIQKSLAMARAASPSILANAGASINHAMQQGVTSKGRLNQGNGLFGLRRAVEINGGRLSVLSGRGAWRLVEGAITSRHESATPVPEPNDHQSTLVDWQLDCSTKVRIEEALGGKYAPQNDLLESIEDDNGEYRVSVSEIEDALGSRKRGGEIRTRLENYLSAGADYVVLDFHGVGVISSSFADEVLGKMAESMGELEFRRRVYVDSTSPTNRSLIERAIASRLDAGTA